MLAISIPSIAVASPTAATTTPTAEAATTAVATTTATATPTATPTVAATSKIVAATPTTTTITASNTDPFVNDIVTFTVTLKAGSTGLSAPIKLWYTYNGGPRIDRKGTFSTTNGVYVFSGPFGSAGTYVYHAEFAGEGTYAASAGTVTVNVRLIPTTTTITYSYDTNLFTITLMAGGTLLSEPVHVYYPVYGGGQVDVGTYNTVFGQVQFSYGFPGEGTYEFHADFAGDSQYASSSGTVTVDQIW